MREAAAAMGQRDVNVLRIRWSKLPRGIAKVPETPLLFLFFRNSLNLGAGTRISPISKGWRNKPAKFVSQTLTEIFPDSDKTKR